MTLVICTTKSGLLRNAGRRLHSQNRLGGRKKTMILYNMQLIKSSYKIKKLSVKDETHENIDDEIYEDELYKLEK